MARVHTAICALAIVGLFLAMYGLYLHESTDAGKFCNVGPTFNCDKVNKSPWSEFFGIPVALLGMLAYATLFLIVLYRRSLMRSLSLTDGDIAQYVGILVLGMLLFQLYLTFAEVVFIKAYCIVCLGSQFTIACIAFLAFIWCKNPGRAARA